MTPKWLALLFVSVCTADVEICSLFQPNPQCGTRTCCPLDNGPSGLCCEQGDCVTVPDPVFGHTQICTNISRQEHEEARSQLLNDRFCCKAIGSNKVHKCVGAMDKSDCIGPVVSSFGACEHNCVRDTSTTAPGHNISVGGAEVACHKDSDCKHSDPALICQGGTCIYGTRCNATIKCYGAEECQNGLCTDPCADCGMPNHPNCQFGDCKTKCFFCK